ncbi:MAG: gas vesicle structural protein GvpA [Deltaproteobacteria bacterium]|nr:gas vesicle structural protein GvpA [Deltaproteobacteria bacterium]
MAEVQRSGGGAAPGSGGLAEVVDLILDKGIVIDAWIRVAIVGLEIITVQARVVIASVDTYLRYADAVAATATAAPPA